MAIKLADTAKPMGDFPVAEGADIEVKVGEKTESLQEAIENGDIGGGGTGKKVIDDEAVGNDTTWSSQKMDSTFLKKDGESSNTTVTFTEPEEETEPQSKDKLSVLVGKFVKKFKSLKGSIGDLTKLKTDEKTNIVGAVNEISDSLVDKLTLRGNLGTRSILDVEDGIWIVNEPNESMPTLNNVGIAYKNTFTTSRGQTFSSIILDGLNQFYICNSQKKWSEIGDIIIDIGSVSGADVKEFIGSVTAIVNSRSISIGKEYKIKGKWGDNAYTVGNVTRHEDGLYSYNLNIITVGVFYVEYRVGQFRRIYQINKEEI